MSTSRDKLRLEHWIAAVLLFTMALIAFINILSRYFFHFSFAATEEITINLFVWMTVIGTGMAFERGGQLGMVTIFNLCPKRLRQGLIVFSSLLSATLFVLVNIYMIQAIYDELTLFHATSGALGVPVWIYYIGVPILSVFVFKGVFFGMRNRLAQLEATGQ